MKNCRVRKMKNGLPKYCSWNSNRHGKRRVRFRKGHLTAYIRGVPWSKEFMQQYAMLLRPPTIAPERPIVAGNLVYFIRIGQFIKIGYTTNLEQRIKSFHGASAELIDVLLTIPGDRDLEFRLHGLFQRHRIRNEFFRNVRLLGEFIDVAKCNDVAFAIEWIECIERGQKIHVKTEHDANGSPRVTGWGFAR